MRFKQKFPQPTGLPRGGEEAHGPEDHRGEIKRRRVQGAVGVHRRLLAHVPQRVAVQQEDEQGVQVLHEAEGRVPGQDRPGDEGDGLLLRAEGWLHVIRNIFIQD